MPTTTQSANEFRLAIALELGEPLNDEHSNEFGLLRSVLFALHGSMEGAIERLLPLIEHGELTMKDPPSFEWMSGRDLIVLEDEDELDDRTHRITCMADDVELVVQISNWEICAHPYTCQELEREFRSMIWRLLETRL